MSDDPSLNFLETTQAHSFASLASLAAKISLSDAVKSTTADLLAADPAVADDAEFLTLGVVVTANDVVVASEFVGTMVAAFEFVRTMTVVGLVCVFVGTVVVVGSTAVVTATAAAAGATNGADVARKEAQVPGGYRPASDASVGDAVVGKVIAAAAPTGWEDPSNPAIVICQ